MLVLHFDTVVQLQNPNVFWFRFDQGLCVQHAEFHFLKHLSQITTLIIE